MLDSSIVQSDAVFSAHANGGVTILPVFGDSLGVLLEKLLV
jgi:hypothetical protein